MPGPEELQQLRLQVILEDNASVGLSALSKQLADIQKLYQIDKMKQQTSAMQDLMKGLGLAAQGVTKAFQDLTGRYSTIVAGAAGFGFAAYRATADFKGMVESSNQLRLTAERLGTSYSTLKNIADEMTKADYSAAEAARLATQVIGISIEARKRTLSPIFQNLIEATHRPDIVLQFQRDIANAGTDEEKINAELRFRKAIGDEIRKNNQGRKQAWVDEQVAYAQRRVMEIQGIDVDLSHAKQLDQSSKDLEQLRNREADQLKRIKDEYNQTVANLEKIKDVVIEPLLSENAPFFRMAKFGAEATKKIADDLEYFRNNFKGSIWDYFKIPDSMRALVNRLLGGTPQRTGAAQSGGGDLAGQLGINAIPVPSGGGIGGHSIRPIEPQGIISYASPAEAHANWDRWLREGRLSTNIEDYRNKNYRGVDPREQNTKLLMQVNEKLYAVLSLVGGGAYGGGGGFGIAALGGGGGYVSGGGGGGGGGGGATGAPIRVPPVSPAPIAPPTQYPGTRGGAARLGRQLGLPSTHLQPAAPSQGSASNPVTGGGGSIDRTRFVNELNSNPALRNKVLAIMAGEQGTNRDGTTAIVESMMNRAAYTGHSLAREARTTGEGGYYAGYRPSYLNNPKYRAILEDSLNRALHGSNISNYATDNSSGGLAARERASGKYKFASTYTGETFFTPGWGPGQANINKYNAWRASLGQPSDIAAAPTAPSVTTSPTAQQLNQTDIDYLAAHGAHGSILKDGKIVPVPPGEGTHNVNPEFVARLAAAGRAYTAATGKEPRFGEMDRPSDVQAVYWDRYQHGGGIAARPGRSRHQGAGPLGEIAEDTPSSEFSTWLHSHNREYGLHFPVLEKLGKDYPHTELDPTYRGTEFASRSPGVEHRIRTVIDRSYKDQNEAAIQAAGKLTVSVNAPAGTTVKASGGGAFTQTEVNRRIPTTPSGIGHA